MDKITIVLQDKTTIVELAKDPEVQIKIIDAVVDALGKRVLKLMNANVEIQNAVNSVSKAISKEVENMFFDSGYWSKTLKDTYKDLINKQATIVFNKLTNKEVYAQQEARKEEIQRILETGVKRWESMVNEKIANFDFNKAIYDAVQEELARRLDKH